MRSIVFIAVLSFTAPARADVAAAKCVAADKVVKPIVLGASCQGFRTGTTEVRFSRIASGTLVASKDGRTVVMIEDYLSGRETNSQIEALYDLDVVVNPKVVHVYRDGKRVAFYDIARLVKDVHKVQMSTSHVRWVASMPTAITGASFEIKTVNNRRITFDSTTGAILDEK
jgi:hypothetical protein